MADFGNELKFNNSYLWVSEVDGKNGKYKLYKFSLAGKDKEGKAEYNDLRVQLPKNCPEIPNKTKVSTEGFLVPDNYINKDGDKVKQIKYVVTHIVLEDGEPIAESTGFAEAEEDIPF